MFRLRHIEYAKEAIYPDDIEAAAIITDEIPGFESELPDAGRTQLDSQLSAAMAEGEMLTPPVEAQEQTNVRGRSAA